MSVTTGPLNWESTDRNEYQKSLKMSTLICQTNELENKSEFHKIVLQSSKEEIQRKKGLDIKYKR